jgi:hypothetical protein
MISSRSIAVLCLFTLVGCATSRGDDVDEGDEQAISAGQQDIVETYLATPFSSKDPAASGVGSWQSVRIKTKDDTTQGSVVFVGFPKGASDTDVAELKGSVEVVVSGDGVVSIRSGDPNTPVRLEPPRLKAIGDDLAALRDLLPSDVEDRSGIKTQASGDPRTCKGSIIAAAAMAAVAAAQGALTVVVCGPGEVATLGAATPLCLISGTATVGGVLATGHYVLHAIRRCRDSE